MSQEWEELNARIRKTEGQVKRVTVQVERASQRRAKLQTSLRELQNTARYLRMMEVVETPPSAEVVALHSQIVSAKNEILRKDITVARVEELHGSIIPGLVRQLQKKCVHSLVLNLNGYEGSRSDDYDDKYPGQRRCAICNLSEQATYPGEVYAVLAEADHRMFVSVARNQDIYAESWSPLVETFKRFFEAFPGPMKIAKQWRDQWHVIARNAP